MIRAAEGHLEYDIEALKRDSEGHPDHMRRYLYLSDHYAQEKNRMEPYAARGRKQLQQVQDIAPIGGKATAHYTDADVTKAFTDFKKRNPRNPRNPRKGAWEAANALIREGQPLARYKTVTSPWNRIERIAKGLGISRDDWFDDL
jgi:hypothetical protein